MADAVVNALVQNLPRLLMQEIDLHYEVRADIESLQGQLRFMQAFLKATEVDGRRSKDEIIKEVINQIRDTLYEAEDSIDTYVYYVQRKTLEKMLHYIDHTNMLHNTANNIKNITRRIEEIKKNQQDYGVQFDHVNDGEAPAAGSRLVHERRKVVEEDDVVGFQRHSAEVIKKLTEGHQQRVVISVVGMGGLGKTTLARKIYKNTEVKKYFDRRAWTYVSKDVNAKGILLSLLGQLVSNLTKASFEEMETKDLKLEIRKSLGMRRYLVVLDDIWDPEAWKEIEDAFPDGQYGSRLLITSRSSAVANDASGPVSNQYHLPFLTKEDSWELFSKKVFRGDECPPHLVDLGRQIAESCDGLPLSIVVLAGLLARRERSEAQWSLVAGNENWHIFRQKTECSQILALSYDYLPRYLKPCFLYVGMYPEDFEIPARQLIRLWISEGLIQEETGNKQPEDVAEFYLMELIDRSLIQVASRRADGGVKTCRIHDILRELCIDESKKDKFYQVYTGNVGNSTLAKPRRLSLCCGASSYQSSSLSSDHLSVRSLICFNQSSSSSSWDSIVKVLKLVRVLDMGPSSHLYNIPASSIEKLIHLRYLRIDHGEFSYSRSKFFYCSLPNLETLEVRGTPSGTLRTVPSRIKKLKRLRHFLMSFPLTIPHLNEPLENLQSFGIAALEDYLGVLFSKAMFPKLRKLALVHSSGLKWTPDKFWPSLGCLPDLQTLKIMGTTCLPEEPHVFPSRLTKITLANFADLGPQVMPLLGAIPSLETLKLSGNPMHNGQGFDIDCKTGEFRNLKAFVMRGVRCRNWNLATGAMPRLQRLVIKRCKVLNNLPDELWSLANLGDVEVLWPSKPLADKLRELEMKDGCKLTLILPLGKGTDK